jgi:hypothetical protein
MGDEKHPDQLKRRLAGEPPATPVTPEPDPRRSTDDDLRPVATGGRLDPEAVARWWGKWTKHLVPVLLSTALAVAAGIPLVISVFRDNMAQLEHKADKAQEKGDQVEKEQKAVYTKVTKPEIEELKAQIAALQAELVADKAAKRVGQRRRPIPVAPVKKVAPLPATPTAVLQAPAPAPPPPPKPDGGQ